MKTILALHGFLGEPSDWQAFEKRIAGRWRAIDLWRWLEEIGPQAIGDRSSDERALQENDAFGAAALRLAEEAARESDGRGKPVLLGYSMGGRLAMRAFAQFPGAFSGAIFVSAHPGLAEGALEERRARAASDEAWARRFESGEDWAELMRAWNAQPALRGSASRADGAPVAKRRVLYAAALRRWSLARQTDLRAALAQATQPSLWVAGENDPKFRDLMRASAAGRANWRSIVGAGHRAPWDRPDEFAALARNFINSV